MDHRMAITAYRNEITHRIDLIGFTNCMQCSHVVDMDKFLAARTIDSNEVKTTHFTNVAISIMRNASFSRSGIALIRVDLNTPYRPFFV